jgi:Flp pilus assembly protein TadG
MVMRIARLATMLRRLRRREDGVSAVEFALILPVMLILFFGCVEVGDALTIDRKVAHVASTLSESPAAMPHRHSWQVRTPPSRATSPAVKGLVKT